MNEITVHSPATVSNVVCGFDCLGFALAEPYDVITLRISDSRGIRIRHLDDFGLSTDPRANVVGVALDAFITATGIEYGFDAEITKGIMPGSGIGSSSASSCGAVVAANILLGEPFTPTQLVEFAMAGEALASGSRHADNAAPCIYGGFTLVRSVEPLDIVSLGFPDLFATVIHPQIEIRTSEARAILPKRVPLAAAVRNWSNLAAFVAALQTGDTELMSRSMKDEIVEPVRSSLIPRFDDLKSACLEAGAIGGGISGSGPSMFMLSVDADIAAQVEAAMRSVYSETGIPYNIYSSQVKGGVRRADT